MVKVALPGIPLWNNQEIVLYHGTLIFVRGSSNATDFWSFVQYCRTVAVDHNRARAAWYDIVAGPVAGSSQKQTVIPDGDQFSFHTNVAARVLDNSQKARVK